MNQEKMLLNDVVIDLPDVSKLDRFGWTEIKLKLPNYLIKELSVSYKENPNIIKDIIDEYYKKIELQHHTTSLSFEGREPRIDVLQKLLRVAIELETYPQFPSFKRGLIECVIKKTLNCDFRTKEKYLKCIKNYVETSTGKQLYFNNDYDLFYFKTIILEKLNEIEALKK